jgi:hypothetical protein
MSTAAVRIARRASWLAAGLIFLCATARAERRAPEPSEGPPWIKVSGECPASGTLSLSLAPVLEKTRAGTAATAHGPPAPPRVTDLGDSFEVAAAGQIAVYADTGRDCAERARIAAVFIALALTTPTAELSAAPATPPSPPRVLAQNDVPPARWAAVTLAARCDGASPGTSPSGIGVACGGELRGAIGRGGLGGFASAGLLAATASSFGTVPVRVDVQRFPFALGATAARELRGGWRVGADVGAAVALLRIRGEGIDTGGPALRFAAGAGIGTSLQLPVLWRGWAPVIALHAEYFPRAYQLDVDPLGTIGALGRLSVGATAGFCSRASVRAGSSR